MKLGTWLDREGLTHTEFAPRIDRTPQAVQRYVAGTRIPDRETMPKIVRETGGEVTANDFFDVPQADHADAGTPACAAPSPGSADEVSADARAA